MQSSVEKTGEYVSVTDFYAGKSVFVTGVTGFLGKVLLEKLLYSCKDIEKIYVLIRIKNGVDSQQRLRQLIDKPLFSRLKAKHPEYFKKIILVLGDISQPDLGISPEDVEIIIEKVSIVFHVAATIKFHEQFNVAVNTNVLGTKHVLDLCQRSKNIKAFVFFSTAYCHSYLKTLEEKTYLPPADLIEVLNFIKQSQHTKEEIMALLKGLPNTYAFTKSLAEHWVKENHGSIPAVIVRPSIVSSSLNELIRGWVDSWAGATGLLTAVAKGSNKILFGEPNNKLDLIPVDYVVNLSIVAAAKCQSSNDLSVYNCCTSSCNPITIAETFQYIRRSAIKSGFHEKRKLELKYTKSNLRVSITTFLQQTMPAYIADLFRRARGRTPRYVKIQSQVVTCRNLLSYYTSHSWELKAGRVQALHGSLSDEDRLQFPCNPSDINWGEFMDIYLKGIDRFLLKKTNKSL